VGLEGDHLSLDDHHRRHERHEDPGAEGQVAPGDGAIEAQGERVGRQRERHGARHQVAGGLADDDRPHAEGRRRRQRHRDGEGDQRLDGLQRALARVVHAPEEDPQRGQQRQGKRQPRDAEREPQQPRLAVRRGEDGSEQGQDHGGNRGQRKLQREGELVLALEVLGLVGHEGLVDAHALEGQHGDDGGRDNPVEADLAGPQQARHDQPLTQDEAVDGDEEGRRDDRPAHRAGAQLRAREVQARAHAAPHRRAASASSATAARTTTAGSAATRRRVKP
jgi:hypothetical protein